MTMFRMVKMWLLWAFIISMVTTALRDNISASDSNDTRECVTLNLNETICPTAVVVEHSLEDKVTSYVVKDKFSQVLGDVTFGDRVLPGDSSYSFRTVHVEFTETLKKVIKVRTVHTGVGSSLQEFVETDPGSGVYEVLVRTPIALDLTGVDMPEYLYPFYNPTTSTTSITVDKKYRNTYRIGMVILGKNVIDDQGCVTRAVSILERFDGKRVVSVETSLYDESVETVTFIESAPGNSDFVQIDKQEIEEDIYVGPVEDDTDLDTHPDYF